MSGYAWITLATNDPYCLGALVLAHSLKRVGTKYDIAILITPGVTSTMREKLNAVFSVVKEVNVLDSKDEANLALLARPELGITFTKLHCWRMTQYEKCVFIDADALVVRNCDELFEREELSAAPDVGWPDCFNSGVFVFKPSQQTFASLTSFAASKGSFDGGDQGLLNQYFSDWAHKDISKHLPFIYNMCSTATYSYLPAYKQYGNDVRIIHFIGNAKPWLQYFDTQTGQVHPSSESAHLQSLLQLWWNIFCQMVHPELSPVMTGIAGALAKITLGSARSPEQEAFEEHLRKHSWEQGKIDYMGRDSFENIWTKICTTISTVTEHEPTAPQKKLIEEDNESKTSQVTATTITKIQSTETEAALPTVLQHQDVVSEIRPRETSEETTEIKSPCCESQKSMIERPNIIHPSVESPPISETTATVPISLDAMQVNLEQILASTCSPSKLDTESSKNDKCSTMKDDVATASCHTEKNTIISQSSAIPPQCPLKITPESLTLTDTQLTEIASKESHVIEETQCAKNITDTAVPIQVAESVLEADIKESVSEDVKPVTEEAISSMSAPIQESISTVVETPLEPPAPAHSQSVAALPPAQANGTDRSDYDSESNENIKPEVTPIPSAVVEPVYAPVSVPEPEIKQLEEDKSDIIEIAPEVGKTDNVQTVERATTSREITTESSITDTVQPTQSSPTAAPMKETIIKDIESKTNVPDEISTQVVLEDLSKKTEEQHEKPMPITQLNIPGTPTIIEATPPTSPPLDAVVTPLEEGTKPTKKVVKKSIKKSSPDEKAEGTETEESKKSKKTTKKSPSVIKKSKESLEEGADSSAVEKPKKIVKVKKTTKPTQNLEADTSVPDTPPPTTSSETPVPPKRKVKPGTAKPSGTSTNKSE